MTQSFEKRALRGLRIGLVFGLTYSFFAAAMTWFAGFSSEKEYGVSLPAIWFFYLSVGVVSGAIVGVLLPLARSRRSLVAVAMAGAVPLAIALGTLFKGVPWKWPISAWLSALVTAVVFGTIGGFLLDPSLDEGRPL